VERDGAGARIDLMVAFAAGPLTWRDQERRYRATERSIAAVGLIGVAYLVTVAIAAVVNDLRSTAMSTRLVALTAFVTGLMVFSHQLWAIARGDRWAPATVWVPLVTRTVFGLGTVIATPILLPSSWFVMTWPVGLAWAANGALVLWAIGIRPIALSGVRRLLASPVTIGAAGAFVAFVVAGIRDDVVVVGLRTIAAFALAVLIAVLTVALFDHGYSAELRMLADAERHLVAREHRRRAQWVHDRVCAEVRRLRLLHATSSMTLQQVGPALDELDHRFRLIQLDELIDGGAASVADLLQPFVRDLQNHQVTITEVPSAEESDLVLTAPVAAQVRQVLANLCSNALNAGATRVGLRVRHDDGHLIVIVSDDAGGFDHQQLPIGRGLDRLRRQLGTDALVLARTDTGTAAECRIDLGADLGAVRA
jgi:signal transduction histidine kinase